MKASPLQTSRAVALLLIAFGGLFAIAGCLRANSSGPERGFAIAELLLDVQDFPEGWYMSTLPSPVPAVDGAIFAPEAIRVEFRENESDFNSASYEVYRFSSSSWAEDEFRKQKPRIFNSQSVAALTPWKVPAALPYLSTVAEQSHFACSQSAITGLWGCRFMGQYEEHLVILSSTLGERMSYADIEHLLRVIDERLKDHLSIE